MKERIPFQDEQTQQSRQTQSRRTSKQQELQLTDSQNTSVNIMRRSSSHHSTKSSFFNKSQTQFRTNSIEFNESIQISKIKEIVIQTASELLYQIDIPVHNRMILIKYNQSSWKQLFSCCCGITSPNTVLISVQLKSNILNRTRTLQLKLLQGDFLYFQQLDNALEEKLKLLEPKTQPLSSSMNLQEKMDDSIINDTSDPNQSPFFIQRKGYIVVQKLLKKSYQTTINKLKENLKNMKIRVISKTLNPVELVNQLLRTINKIYEEVYQQLSIYNFDIVYYSIQKILSELCLPIISESYQLRWAQQQIIFIEKRQKILKQWENYDIISYLQIKPQFQLIPEGSTKTYTPYLNAIHKLSNIHFNLSLRQKLKVVQEYYSALKVSCYEFHKGKQEIATMDDILPVIIFTVLKATVNNFYSELKMVDDYARSAGRFQGDQRILTNLFVGLQYVSKQWVVD